MLMVVMGFNSSFVASYNCVQRTMKNYLFVGRYASCGLTKNAKLDLVR